MRGTNELSFEVPSTSALGATYARFRLSSSGGLAPTGLAPDGEVEDYLVGIFANPYQNPDPRRRHDVNDNGLVTPLDAMLVLRELDEPTIRDVDGRLPIPPGPGQEPPPFVDVNGDGFVSPLDAMLVINELSRLNTVGTFQALQPSPDQANVARGVPSGQQISPPSLPLDHEMLVGAQPLIVDPPAFVYARVGGEQRVSEAVDPAVVSLAHGDNQLAKDSAVSVEMDDTLDELADDVQLDQTGEDALDRMFAGGDW